MYRYKQWKSQYDYNFILNLSKLKMRNFSFFLGSQEKENGGVTIKKFNHMFLFYIWTIYVPQELLNWLSTLYCSHMSYNFIHLNNSRKCWKFIIKKKKNCSTDWPWEVKIFNDLYKWQVHGVQEVVQFSALQSELAIYLLVYLWFQTS